MIQEGILFDQDLKVFQYFRKSDITAAENLIFGPLDNFWDILGVQTSLRFINQAHRYLKFV